MSLRWNWRRGTPDNNVGSVCNECRDEREKGDAAVDGDKWGQGFLLLLLCERLKHVCIKRVRIRERREGKEGMKVG